MLTDSLLLHPFCIGAAPRRYSGRRSEWDYVCCSLFLLCDFWKVNGWTLSLYIEMPRPNYVTRYVLHDVNSGNRHLCRRSASLSALKRELMALQIGATRREATRRDTTLRDATRGRRINGSIDQSIGDRRSGSAGRPAGVRRAGAFWRAGAGGQAATGGRVGLQLCTDASRGHYETFTPAGSRLQVVTWLRVSWYPAFPIGSYPSILSVWILSVCLFIRLLVRVVLCPTKCTAKNLVR